ncbi:sulfotransferase [Sphingomicrobium sp. XHP0235]|uniref:tetratricopeptide repeat-containing sulfotransferase family protein n=1 Tax=Sphingomicrobium aquimarinum TaxID=3133971 RepID=UPI0031FE7EB8
MNEKPLLVQAIDALQAGDRDSALALFAQELREGPETGDRWRSVAMVARKIGETRLAIEAARRFAATQPQTLQRILFYWDMLATLGREDEVEREAKHLSPATRNQASIQHLLGTIAAGRGDNRAAEEHFRAAIAAPGFAPTSWFALSMIKSFGPDDPDISAMEKDLAAARDLPDDAAARYRYALGKAYLDSGEVDRAMKHYRAGASIRRRSETYDRAAIERQVDTIISDFDAAALSSLMPSRYEGSRALFVNGVPRSGSTLVEQILTSHSAVEDGGEISLIDAALLPLGGPRIDLARSYEQRAGSSDPWGTLAAKYEQLLEQRFGADGLIVDKTLLQSNNTGLLLHMLPDARMVWMKRNPRDAAWSTYRNYFTGALPFSWDLGDIGHFYRMQDRLHEHWTALFPDRIRTLQYEELVKQPETHIRDLAAFYGLGFEDAMLHPHRTERSVRTASVSQVRAPIHERAVRQSSDIDAYLEAFDAVYDG